MAKILLPSDPDFDVPVVMGNAYEKTPKAALEKRIADEQQRPEIFKYASSMLAPMGELWHKYAQSSGVNNMMTSPMWFSPLHTPQSWQIASRRREVYMWARHFTENEPKVAAAIQIYSNFPMNGFDLKCKSRKVLNYYKHRVVKRLRLNEMFKMISSEYFMLGDVFIHTNIQCPLCNGSSVDPSTGEVCNHQGGTFDRITVLNPDWIEVKQSSLAPEPAIVMNADDDLKRIVFYKQPRAIYDMIPNQIKQLILRGQPIPLSNRTVSHLKHMPVPYGTYGTSLIRRLFTTLAYKTKLMSANWIVAERLILPVRVVKIGSDDRPATTADIADVQQQLAATANDPNLTLVTHHSFEYDFFGACYDDQTEILTPDGWEKIEHIKEGQIVGTYNKQNGNLEFQTVAKKQEYYFKSNHSCKMVHIKHRSADICVTPNHRMLIFRHGEWQVVEAKDLQNNDRLLSSMGWAGEINHTDFKSTPLSHLTEHQFLEFVGYYISEGSQKIERYKNLAPDKQIQGCVIHQSVSSKFYNSIHTSVQNTYPRMSISFDKNKYKPVHNMTINNVQIARYLAHEFGANSHTKRIPKWVRNLPTDYLSTLIEAMMDGDGSRRFSEKNKKQRYTYSTVSKELCDNVVEILLKLGSLPCVYGEKYEDWIIYRVFWSENRKTSPINLRTRPNVHLEEYDGNVYCVTVNNSFIVTRRNGKITVQGNSGKILQVTQEMEFISKEILDGFMLNQSLLNGEGQTYSGASVGVEALIRRIESWRSTLAQWCEENIFLPIAEMQGFIDEEQSEEIGETCYLYPKIKWNDLQLRDKNQWYQLLVGLQQNGIISQQTLMEELGLDYDQEVKRLRYEQIVVGPAGGMLGMGAAGGGMGLGGGGPMGGAGPAGGPDPTGGMGGAPGDMMGGAPGSMDPAAAGAMGGMTPSAQTHKITKKGKHSKEEQKPVPMPMLKLTRLEQKASGMLIEAARTLNIAQNHIRAQFPVQNPNGGKPYTIDFALPRIKLGIEVDGEIFHNSPQEKADDQKRDTYLARQGWTILRFDDKSIEETPSEVKKTIIQYIMQKTQPAKTASVTSDDIYLFTSRNNSLINLSSNYDKYFDRITQYSENIGDPVYHVPPRDLITV